MTNDVEEVVQIIKSGIISRDRIKFRYVNRNYWTEIIHSELPSVQIVNLTDLNDSICFTLFVFQVTDTRLNIGDGTVLEYINKHGDLEFVTIEVSMIASYATLKKSKYSYADDRLKLQEIPIFHDVTLNELADRITSILDKNRILLLSDDELMQTIRFDIAPFKQKTVTVHEYLFLDEDYFYSVDN